MLQSTTLCLLLMAVAGQTLTRGGHWDEIAQETQTRIFDNDLPRFRRGAASAIDKILRKSSVVHASNLARVYKRKGGYTQALKDFESLVPKPSQVSGLKTKDLVHAGGSGFQLKVKQVASGRSLHTALFRSCVLNKCISLSNTTCNSPLILQVNVRLIMLQSTTLCMLLMVVAGQTITGGGHWDEIAQETQTRIFDDLPRFRRGAASAIDKILRKSSVVHASNLARVYKRKGGYTQALKDFESLVPKPSQVNGLSRFGHIEGKQRVYLQTEFGKPVLSIWHKNKKKETIVDKIEYF